VIADRDATPALELMLRGFQLRRRVEAVDPMTDTEQLAADLQAAVSDASELGDPRVTLTMLGQSVRSARTIGHLCQAAHHAEEAVELARSASLPVAEATFELLGAMVAHADGRVADAAALGARALMRARRLDLRVLTAQAALLLRQLPAGTPDVLPVLPSAPDVLDLLDGQFDDRSSIGPTYGVAGECMLAGDPATAARAAAVGMRTASAIGLPAGIDPGVMIVVALAAQTGEAALAARLHGALADHLEQARRSLAPGQQSMYDRIVDLVRHRLGDEAFAREMGRGAGCTRRAMLDEALRFADTVAGQGASDIQPEPPPLATPSLTRRELEVLRLLAEGSTNKEIAARLGMAPKTAMHHTSKIYRKLDVRGRGQAAAWARRAGIV
jgi:DNA-binding NarL/FixJ family response regulator